MATHTAQFEITVDKFRSIGSLMTCSITMEAAVALPSPVTKVGSYSMSIAKPATGETEDILIQFSLKDKKYLLLGVAFSAKNFSQAAAAVKCGQQDFSEVTLAPVASTSGGTDRVMTIKNNRKNKGVGQGKYGSFDYLLIIQEVDSGEIGVIDPEIINEE